MYDKPNGEIKIIFQLLTFIMNLEAIIGTAIVSCK
jgi:hypothetical protein